MAEQIGTYHLADNPRYFEVQRNNTFEFVVTDIDGIMRAGAIGTEANAKINNAQEMLRLSVVKSSIPHFTQDIIEVKRGNSTLKYAGTPSFDAGTTTLFESTQQENTAEREERLWIEAVREGKEPLTKPEEAFVITKILEGIYTSAKTGTIYHFN